jgi:hypothetical protein
MAGTPPQGRATLAAHAGQRARRAACVAAAAHRQARPGPLPGPPISAGGAGARAAGAAAVLPAPAAAARSPRPRPQAPQPQQPRAPPPRAPPGRRPDLTAEQAAFVASGAQHRLLVAVAGSGKTEALVRAALAARAAGSNVVVATKVSSVTAEIRQRLGELLPEASAGRGGWGAGVVRAPPRPAPGAGARGGGVRQRAPPRRQATLPAPVATACAAPHRPRSR